MSGSYRAKRKGKIIVTSGSVNVSRARKNAAREDAREYKKQLKRHSTSADLLTLAGLIIGTPVLLLAVLYIVFYVALNR